MEYMENREEVDVIREKPERKSKGWSIASMILGICGLLFFCIPFFPILCGILAIIFALLGRAREKSGMAIAGLITGIIAIIISVIITIMIVLSPVTDNETIVATKEMMDIDGMILITKEVTFTLGRVDTTTITTEFSNSFSAWATYEEMVRQTDMREEGLVYEFSIDGNTVVMITTIERGYIGRSREELITFAEDQGFTIIRGL
ncbi:MAG: DUF4190 domain-containing protein [Oscillospiraceae bacterium]|nr:DUF4190 domain-containing protein [Oscillospiraceae bacterium]